MIIIIIYIYHALINALSAHMVHIDLNTIFYTHVEHLKYVLFFMIKVEPQSMKSQHLKSVPYFNIYS